MSLYPVTHEFTNAILQACHVDEIRNMLGILFTLSSVPRGASRIVVSLYIVTHEFTNAILNVCQVHVDETTTKGVGANGLCADEVLCLWGCVVKH